MDRVVAWSYIAKWIVSQERTLEINRTEGSLDQEFPYARGAILWRSALQSCANSPAGPYFEESLYYSILDYADCVMDVLG